MKGDCEQNGAFYLISADWRNAKPFQYGASSARPKAVSYSLRSKAVSKRLGPGFL